MKKMISLGLIICASLTSNTMFGMFMQQLKTHTKRFALSQKKYHNSTDTTLMQIATKIDHQTSLLKQEIAATQAINQKVDILIKNLNETKNNQEHRLIEMEELLFESKYSKEFNAYHEQLAYHAQLPKQ